MRHIGDYVLRVLLGLDRAANAILLGSPEETISARAGRWAARQDRGFKRRIGGLVCGMLEAVDPGHCAAARRSHLERRERRTITAYPYRGRIGHANHLA